ncbi:MAG: hypothetical protein ACOY3I_10230 [Verrucomicrobiota bacterium]
MENEHIEPEDSLDEIEKSLREKRACAERCKARMEEEGRLTQKKDLLRQRIVKTARRGTIFVVLAGSAGAYVGRKSLKVSFEEYKNGNLMKKNLSPTEFRLVVARVDQGLAQNPNLQEEIALLRNKISGGKIGDKKWTAKAQAHLAARYRSGEIDDHLYESGMTWITRQNFAHTGKVSKCKDWDATEFHILSADVNRELAQNPRFQSEVTLLQSYVPVNSKGSRDFDKSMDWVNKAWKWTDQRFESNHIDSNIYEWVLKWITYRHITNIKKTSSLQDSNAVAQQSQWLTSVKTEQPETANFPAPFCAEFGDSSALLAPLAIGAVAARFFKQRR